VKRKKTVKKKAEDAVVETKVVENNEQKEE
jgi:hypothetical protein